MAKLELTLDQARKNSATFLYIFTDFKVNGKAYLSYIDSKHRDVILGKRGNQIKLLMLSAEEYLGSMDNYSQYVNAVREGFIETYGMKPEEALIKLAKGETVAGKNWEKGVYGVQGIGKTNTFYGTNVTVDPQTGHIFKDGTDITDLSDIVTATVGTGKNKKTINFQFFAYDGDVTYMSQYNTTYKKYYAQSYSNGNGTFKATSGAAQSKTDAATLFENVQLGTLDFLGWLEQLLAFFGINLNFGSSSSSKTDIETINEKNTLPNQRADGYVQDDPSPDITTAAGIALAAVAAGTLIMGGLKRKSSK